MPSGLLAVSPGSHSPGHIAAVRHRPKFGGLLLGHLHADTVTRLRR